MCGCAKSANIPVISNNINPIIVNPEDCTVTLEQIITKKNYLDLLRNSSNNSFINANIGLLNTMINTGKYCLYDMASMSL